MPSTQLSPEAWVRLNELRTLEVGWRPASEAQFRDGLEGVSQGRADAVHHRRARSQRVLAKVKTTIAIKHVNFEDI
jgi:hypothetical protein